MVYNHSLHRKVITLKRVGTSPGFVSSSPFVVNKVVIGWDLSPRNKFPLLVFFNEFVNQIFTWFSVLMQIQNFHFWFCPPLWPQKFWFPPLSRLPRPLYIAGNVDPPRVISKRNECTEGSCRRFERQFNEKEKKNSFRLHGFGLVSAWFWLKKHHCAIHWCTPPPPKKRNSHFSYLFL